MSRHTDTTIIGSGKVLFVLIPEYADWEAAFLAAGLRRGLGLWQPRYSTYTVAPTASPVRSVGGFQVIPDYTFETAPEDIAALILVGGMSWFDEEAVKVVPLVHRALARGAVLGAICDASIFLGVHGFLNEVQHTSNSLELLKAKAGAAYTGEKLYHAEAQSVRDGTMVTANGVGFIEFARDVFTALNVAPQQDIETFHTICKSGFLHYPGAELPQH